MEEEMMLTKYECSRIIGVRVLQLQMNAPILIDINSIPRKKNNEDVYSLRARVVWDK